MQEINNTNTNTMVRHSNTNRDLNNQVNVCCLNHLVPPLQITETRNPDRAIIITVNYVFSDENRPAVPNRSGSLIMSLPNNASNREPSVIQEFIRLATQMAYSSIVTGLNRERGLL